MPISVPNFHTLIDTNESEKIQMLKQEGYDLMGAAFEVYNVLGRLAQTNLSPNWTSSSPPSSTERFEANFNAGASKPRG